MLKTQEPFFLELRSQCSGTIVKWISHLWAHLYFYYSKLCWIFKRSFMQLKNIKLNFIQLKEIVSFIHFHICIVHYFWEWSLGEIPNSSHFPTSNWVQMLRHELDESPKVENSICEGTQNSKRSFLKRAASEYSLWKSIDVRSRPRLKARKISPLRISKQLTRKRVETFLLKLKMRVYTRIYTHVSLQRISNSRHGCAETVEGEVVVSGKGWKWKGYCGRR